MSLGYDICRAKGTCGCNISCHTKISLSLFPSVLHAGFHLINFLHPALQVLSNCCANNLRTVTITVGLVYTYTLELLLSLSRTMPPAFLSIMSMELKILTFIILKSYFIYFNIQFYNTSYINGLIFTISQTLLIFFSLPLCHQTQKVIKY